MHLKKFSGPSTQSEARERRPGVDTPVSPTCVLLLPTDSAAPLSAVRSGLHEGLGMLRRYGRHDAMAVLI